MDLNEEWESFQLDSTDTPASLPQEVGEVPQPSPLYISTQTYIAYLDQPIDLKSVFWELYVIPYTIPEVGIVKKQMKFNSNTSEEVAWIDSKMHEYEYGYPTIIQHIDNANGTVKFKDIRKVTIGISRKDLLSYRIKPKGAFYNCIVTIIRIRLEERFREFHVKIFNTGKIEIPGIQTHAHISMIVEILLGELHKIIPSVRYVSESEQIVLINSNFNCGYFINREKLFTQLKYKYHISSVYDPCSYPGIQSQLYFDKDTLVFNRTDLPSVSFMVFRTGSILIVGKCTEHMIHHMYEYISTLLIEECPNIIDTNCVHVKKELHPKKIKKIISLK